MMHRRTLGRTGLNFGTALNRRQVAGFCLSLQTENFRAITIRRRTC